MSELHSEKDDVLLNYIEGFYQAINDHERALYGAYIIGALEMILANKLDYDSNKHE